MHNRLRDERHKLGLSQRKVAVLVGCNGASISLWERNLRRPYGRNAARLEGIFGLPVAQLLEARSAAAPEVKSDGADDVTGPAKSQVGVCHEL